MTPLVIYTALIGHVTHDRLRQPRFACGRDVRFVCFTDHPIRDGGRWQIRRVSGTRLPDGTPVDKPRRVARYYKLMPHVVLPIADTWLWHDACMVLRRDPWDLVNRIGNAPLATFRHPGRRCIYAEHQACVKYKKDDPVVMQQQIDQIRFLGYPPDNGLAETACLVRRNTPEVAKFNERWWQIVAAGSLRDQLSFDFVAWEQSFPYVHLPGARLHTPHFVTYYH